VKRLVARELTLSFVPDPEQRLWRTVTRRKYQLTRDRVRLNNQLESLLEDAHIKLSSVVSDLLGLSARRMLKALADGETNPAALAALADQKLRATPEQLCDALGACTELKPVYRRLLKMALEQSWVGACPGDEESAGVNYSHRSPQGNRHMRRLLNQAANSAATTKGSIFEIVYRRKVSRLGHNQTIAAIAHRQCRLIGLILHHGVPYEERGPAVTKESKQRRAWKMIRQLRKLGCRIESPTPQPTQAQAQ
jgi:transposase